MTEATEIDRPTIDKAEVARLYGSADMVRLMALGPNAYVALATAGRDLQGVRVLELFCGTGYLSHALARRGAVCHGIDLCPEAIEHARALAPPGARFEVGDVERLELPPRYDLVVLSYGLQYVRDPGATLDRAIACLDPSRPGRMLVADAYKIGRLRAIWGMPGQLWGVVRLGRRHGASLRRIFAVVRESSRTFPLFGLPEWKALEDIRQRLTAPQMRAHAQRLGARYSSIGNAYFVIDYERGADTPEGAA